MKSFTFCAFSVLLVTMMFLVKSDSAMSTDDLYGIFSSKIFALQAEFEYMKNRITKLESQPPPQACQCSEIDSKTVKDDDGTGSERNSVRSNTALMTLIRKALTSEKRHVRTVEKRVIDSVAMMNASMESFIKGIENGFESFTDNMKSEDAAITLRMSLLKENQKRIDLRLENFVNISLANLTRKIDNIEADCLKLEENTYTLESKISELDADYERLNSTLRVGLQTLTDRMRLNEVSSSTVPISNPVTQAPTTKTPASTVPISSPVTQAPTTKTLSLTSSNIRLVNGSSPYSGRVEVNIDGNWGTVCDDQWDLEDSRVVCRMFGLPVKGYYHSAQFGRGTGPILLDNVQCNGSESSLFDCQASHTHNCAHNEDVGVACTGVRLVGGDDELSGRLEVYLNGEWGTVCDDNFDTVDAKIACLSMDYSDGTVRNATLYGQGSGPILMDDIECTGQESHLHRCPHNTTPNCDHSEDVGIECEVHPVRLVDGTSSSGRVEIFYNGVWGAVCDDNWDASDARVVCRQLGLSGGLAIQKSFFGTSTGSIVMDDVECLGSEGALSMCPFNLWGQHNCGDSEHAGVECT